MDRVVFLADHHPLLSDWGTNATDRTKILSAGL
jgi:hypothetical protein